VSVRLRVPAWQHDAACAHVGGDWWFPEPHARIPDRVLAICAGCPVRRACLCFALGTGVRHGVWAGLNPAELSDLRQRILDGRPADEVIVSGLQRGERSRAAVYNTAAPCPPPGAAELAHETTLVANAIAVVEAAESATVREVDVPVQHRPAARASRMCGFCGRSFRPAKTGRPPQYCSKSCGHAAHRHRRAGSDNSGCAA